MQHCSVCHQADGSGVPGVTPPLKGAHWKRLLSHDGTYVLEVLLYGLNGKIEVAGDSYNGVMPSFSKLTDTELALLVQHVNRLNNDSVRAAQPLNEARVAELRGRELKSKMREKRALLLKD